ncbi:glycosyltransferase family 39 protein [Butyrivibrio sp. X503]|uniref:glycosyltransferase family 39 protein n=1 Tax=Butyrivibrio sp. X503 TaxID=2364878 RepID=UPI001313F00D|nr:glycosyltransferase family 39 protein [Butyrivibrio sp. X503]
MLNESFVAKSEKRIYDSLPHEPETIAVTLFIIGMAVYYLWRMFAITPQYDELYTYYTFISRGPIYSAIHWPLPNNHVGYSVLSAILDLFGNSFIGLRGVSFVCAVSNLILVYRICKRYYAHGLPFGAVCLYASMQVVNEYSVQGRGYTLATTCFLLAIYVIGDICRIGEDNKFPYAKLIIALTLGLYTVPSSVYWVIPVCMSAVLFLVINAYRSKGVYKKISDNIYYKKLKALVFSGIMAALTTFFLYFLIWLAIGSNLLVKTEGSSFFGMSHAKVILHAPFKAVGAGIDYMLSQPYIQSVSTAEFNARYPGWIMNLLEYMIPRGGVLLLIFIIISLGCLFYECIKHFEYSRTVINLVVIVNVLFIAIVLVLQHKLPYLRVFSYSGFIMTLCFCTVMERLINVTIRFYNKNKAKDTWNSSLSRENETVEKSEKWYSGIGIYIPMVFMVFVFVFRFFNPSFSMQLGGRENEIFNLLYIADVENRDNMAVLDCDQQYLLKFGWDIDCEKTDVTDADCVIIDKNMTVQGYSGEDFWKFYQTYETIDWDYLATLRVLYENDNFVLYIK